jgi:2-polyprenyl-3-methyl-5-hydroxy-6-metoxy-1,4-benzoquinol methylase
MANLFDIDDKPIQYYRNKRLEMLEFIPRDVKTLLEVGCSEGGFSESVKQNREAEVWGIEINRTAAEKAAHKIDKVLVGNLENEDLDLPLNYFDCIVFNDVLEHFLYPWIILKNLKKCLKSDGCIVASIPNVRYFETLKDLVIAKNWNYTDYGILDKTHFRFFTINSIRNMFHECGYSVSRMEGINGVNLPWKLNLLNKMLFNKLDDLKYINFACVAHKSD